MSFTKEDFKELCEFLKNHKQPARLPIIMSYKMREEFNKAARDWVDNYCKNVEDETKD